MKFSFLAGFILSAFSVFSQVPTGLPMTNSKGWIKYGYLQSDSGSIPARRDTNFTARYPTIVYWENSAGSDTSFWVSNGRTSGRKWVKYGAGWSLTGNAGTDPSTNFLGTTDNQSLSFRVNNTQFMRLHNTGNNISIGEGAMLPTQTGINGIAIGFEALKANTSGNGNIALGYQSFLLNTTRKGNVGIGWQTGQSNVVGEHNTYVGTHAGQFVNAGNENVGIGSYSLEYSNNTEAGMNTAVGTYSRFFGGNMTTAVGYQSGYANTFPSPSTKPSLYSTSVGYKSLYTMENDTSVTAIGDFTLGASGIKNATAIGSRAYVGQNNSLVLGSINGINGATANTKVGIGTHIPDSTLHVVGGLKFVTGRQGAGKVLTSNASGGADWETASFYWADRGSNNVSNTNSGNVGIGNTSPLFKLDVSGNANIEGSINAGPALTVTNTSTSSSSGLVVNCASTGSTALASFVSNGSNRFTIRNTGELLVNNSAGSSGQVLQSNGIGSPPSWATPSSGLWSQSGNNYTTGTLSLGTSSSSAKLAIETNSVASVDEGIRLEYTSSVTGAGSKIAFTTINNLAEVGSIVNKRVGAGAYSTTYSQWDGASNEQFMQVLSTGVAGSNAVGIGGAPDASAKLDVSSTAKGFLPPRMTTTQINAIPSPATGLVVFNTTIDFLCFKASTGWKRSDGSNM